MMNRKGFIQSVGAGLVLPSTFRVRSEISILPVPGPGLIKTKSEAETWVVREQTPITIHISVMTDRVTPLSLCIEQILPGKGIATHKHLNEDEYFCFLSGEGMFVLDGTQNPVGPGSVAYVPKNTWHGLQNTGSGLFEFIFGYTPGGFEDFFRKIGTPGGQPFVAKSKAEILRWAAHYGMVYQ